MPRAYLLLENGMVFEGEGFGASGTRVGELVFTTGMTGCAESLTDPSYRGQLVTFTFPMLGNYGICYADRESPHIHARAVVVREYCREPSNFRSETDVDSFLRSEGVCGICGVDTRRITQLIRDKGVMNAAVTDAEPDEALLERVRAHRVCGVVDEVTVKEPRLLLPEGQPRFSVAMLDFGYKRSIGDCLLEQGCAVTVYPAKTSAETILAAGHDGVMLSNGPGDPAENGFCIEQIRLLMDKLPVFGICLGHQMMALAAGARTRKMKFGHRGANHPVKNLQTGKIEITSQNHSFAVDVASLEGTGLELTHVNLLDGTAEGVACYKDGVFSMQYHPESASGPQDSAYLFDKFTKMMEDWKNA